LANFGEVPMEQIDKFMLQTHLNRLARTLPAGRVMHARFFMKSIFEEAIDQGLVERNPARKLILPKELRPVDRTTLTWDQLRLVLASVPLRERILLTLEMTETFRPSELFALRWSGFDMNRRTLTVSQTAYRGKLRDYGKTKKSLRTVHVPEGLGNELWLWKLQCPNPAAEAFIFPNSCKRNGGKAERLHPHGQLLRPCAQAACDETGTGQVELPGVYAAQWRRSPRPKGASKTCRGSWNTAKPTRP
jgi:integrase